MRTLARDIGARAFFAYLEVVRAVLNLVVRVLGGARVVLDLVLVFNLEVERDLIMLSPSTFFL